MFVAANRTPNSRLLQPLHRRCDMDRKALQKKRIPAWAVHNTSAELIANIKRRHKRQQIRRNRIKLALAVCIITIALISTVVFAQGSDEKKDYQPIAVEAGDTLWELADQYYPGTDKRTAISDIKERNNLKSSEIFVGDVLLVPESD